MPNELYRMLLELRVGARWPLSARQQRLVDHFLTTDNGDNGPGDDMFKLLLEWRAVSEPWPLGSAEQGVFDTFLQREARKRGFDSPACCSAQRLNADITRMPAG
jgi:hypothetical protein